MDRMFEFKAVKYKTFRKAANVQRYLYKYSQSLKPVSSLKGYLLFYTGL